MSAPTPTTAPVLAANTFAGKNVVITGATSGLGVDIARAFVDAGAKVVIGGRRAKEGATVAKEVGATYVQVDVASEESNTAFFAAAAEKLGSFDIVLLNAGVEGDATKNSAPTLGVDNYEHTFGINVRGVLVGQREALKYTNADGQIVYTSSGASVLPFDLNPVYAASKAALDSLARSFAVQFAKSEDAKLKTLKVYSINPMVYVSEMSRRFSAGAGIQVSDLCGFFNISKQEGTGTQIARIYLALTAGKLPYASGDNIETDIDTHWNLKDYFPLAAAAAAKAAAGEAAKK
jgi:NAD(P)-dependent dehydrogenase (short-subunit alcohol dehydrogenase family)